MSELQVASPYELVHLFEQFADQVGGELYSTQIMDGFAISKRLIGRRGVGESGITFIVNRTRDFVSDEIVDVDYGIRSSTTVVVPCLPPEVVSYGEIDLSDLDNDDVITQVDSTTFNLNVTSLRVQVDNQRAYEIDDEEIIEVPVLDGKAIYDDEVLENHDANPIFSKTKTGITVVEFANPQQTATKSDPGSHVFDTIVGQLDRPRERAELVVQRMLGAFSILKTGLA